MPRVSDTVFAHFAKGSLLGPILQLGLIISGTGSLLVLRALPPGGATHLTLAALSL